MPGASCPNPPLPTSFFLTLYPLFLPSLSRHSSCHSCLSVSLPLSMCQYFPCICAHSPSFSLFVSLSSSICAASSFVMKSFCDHSWLSSILVCSVIVHSFQSLKNAASLRKFSDEISQYDGFIWIPCYSFSPHFPIAMKAISKYNRQNPRMVCGNPMHHKSVIDFWGERKLNHRLSTGW